MEKKGDKLSILLSREGCFVYTRKLQLLSTTERTDGHVVKLKEALGVFRTELCKWADSVRVAQGANHDVVEICRARKREHRREISSTSIDITTTNKKIDCLQSEIRTCKYQAVDCDYTARLFENSATAAQTMSNNHVIAAAVGSGTALLVGVALAPVTGGISLAVAGAVAVVNTATNGGVAIVHNNNANGNERRADKKRTDARQYRQEILEHTSDIRKKENDIARLRKNEDELEAVCIALGDVEDMIYMLITTVEERLISIQNVEMLLQQAIVNGDALSIILRALENDRKGELFLMMYRRKYLSSKAEELGLRIEEAWSKIECIILPHQSVRSVSTGMYRPQLM